MNGKNWDLAVTNWMNIPFKWAAIRFVNTLIKSILCLVFFSAWSLLKELPVFLQPAILLVWRGEGQEKEEERRCIIFEVGAALIAPSQLPPFARRGCRPARRSRFVPQCPSTIAHPAHRPSPTLQSLLPAVYRSDPLQDILRCTWTTLYIIARHPKSTWTTWSTALKPDLPGRRSKLCNKCNMLTHSCPCRAFI